MRTKFISTLLLISLIVIASSCNQNETGWNGIIEKENGIEIIKNPSEPFFGEIILDLEEDLVIGNEEDENYLFWGVKDIFLDVQDDIYVVDMNNYRIQIFNRNGEYLRTIGRYGQGPSEFQLPTLIRINHSSGYIYVKNYSRDIRIFDRLGENLENINLEGIVSDFIPTSDGNIITIFTKLSETNLEYSDILCQLDSKGKTTRSYAEFPSSFFAGKNELGVFMLTTGYDYALYLAKLDNQTCVYGYSKNYELSVFDIGGNVLYRIYKDEPPPSFTSDEIINFKRLGNLGYKPPKFKPYFFKILTDSKGRIYVQRNNASKTMKGHGSVDISNKEVDVFSREGYFIYETLLPPNTIVIRNGFIYAYEINEDKGLEIVKRFKIKNWDQIKMGL